MKKLYVMLAAVLLSAAAMAETAGAIITREPAGKAWRNLYRTSKVWSVYRGQQLWNWELKGYTCTFVEGDDGAVYLDRPLASVATRGWLKGYKATGDTLKFDLPQPAGKRAANGDSIDTYYYRMVVKTFIDEKGKKVTTYVADPASQTLSYVWRNDSLLKVDTALVALATADGQWLKEGDETTVAYVNTDTPTAAPSMADKAEDYDMATIIKSTWGEATRRVKVVRDAQHVYINGLVDGAKDAWARGDVEGSHVVFRRQYLGLGTDTTYSLKYHAYLVPMVVDSLVHIMPYLKAETDRVTFNYDAEAGTLQTDSAFSINVGRENPKENQHETFYQMFFAPAFFGAATPQDPKITRLGDYSSQNGYGFVEVNLNGRGTQGEILDWSKLYYKVFFNGQPKVFTPAEYKALTEDMTDVPYTFKDMRDFFINGYSHEFYFHDPELQSVGVQLFYAGGGETRSSQIVTANLTPTSIHNPSAVGNLSVTYRDLSGRVISRPAHGLYLQTVKLADGSVKTLKVVKR